MGVKVKDMRSRMRTKPKARSPLLKELQRWAWRMLTVVGAIAVISQVSVYTPNWRHWLAPGAPADPRSTPPAMPANTAISPTADDLVHRWIISPVEAHTLITNGATVLDARNPAVQHFGMVRGSVAVSWRQFSQPDAPHQGELLTDLAELANRLQAVGVRGDRPVIVLADPRQGWGEDGRIVWMLRTLGHPQAVLVDGGYGALASLDLPKTLQVAHTAASPGDFAPRPHATWSIDRATLRQRLAQGTVTLIDTRTRAEFLGATPYGETRGGHIPGAIHLDYQNLLQANSTLRPRAEILALLQARGIADGKGDRPIVAYCTGGIRSGWLTAVLIDLGLPAQNYAGSLWDWSAAPPTDYPLIAHP